MAFEIRWGANRNRQRFSNGGRFPAARSGRYQLVPAGTGDAANRYAKVKDTAYTKIIADKGLNLHYRSAVMETYGAFGDSLWGIITELTDPNTHPRASGDYDPWSRPDPRRDFILSLAFAQQRGNAVMLRQASARRLRNRAGGRHAAGARA